MRLVRNKAIAEATAAPSIPNLGTRIMLSVILSDATKIEVYNVNRFSPMPIRIEDVCPDRL